MALTRAARFAETVLGGLPYAIRVLTGVPVDLPRSTPRLGTPLSGSNKKASSETGIRGRMPIVVPRPVTDVRRDFVRGLNSSGSCEGVPITSWSTDLTGSVANPVRRLIQRRARRCCRTNLTLGEDDRDRAVG
jgi:hypothetical protein